MKQITLSVSVSPANATTIRDFCKSSGCSFSAKTVLLWLDFLKKEQEKNAEAVK